jgi:Rrf2 family protein
VRISAKADYAVRAMVELAALEASEEHPAKGDRLADAQTIPMRFLENILAELRQNGLVKSRRGADGGYWLGRDPGRVSIAEVIRAVEGPLASVRGERPPDLDYHGSAEPLKDVWIALRSNVREILDSVTLADVVDGELPAVVRDAAERSSLP